MINQILNSYWLLAGFLTIPPFIAFIKDDQKKFNQIMLSYFITFIVGAVLKRLTASPRPFVQNPQVLGITSNIPGSHSFPSLHSALITVFAWGLATLIPQLSWFGFGIALFIAFSRVYIGVHYYSDIVAGFLIGTFLFWAIYILFNPKQILPKKSNPNIRRKLFHLVYGVVLAGLIQFDMINTVQLGLITLISGALVMSSQYLIPKNISLLVLYFERQKDPKYYGLGPFFFLVSAFVTTLIFSKPIAIAAILNLAVGDSVNALLGHFWKKKSWLSKVLPENSLNPKKRLEASFTATIATIIVALNYVTPVQALLGSTVTLLLEYSEPKFRGKKIDDNLIIPTASGFLMSLV